MLWPARTDARVTAGKSFFPIGNIIAGFWKPNVQSGVKGPTLRKSRARFNAESLQLFQSRSGLTHKGLTPRRPCLVAAKFAVLVVAWAGLGGCTSHASLPVELTK